jgi:hypothetical protein
VGGHKDTQSDPTVHHKYTPHATYIYTYCSCMQQGVFFLTFCFIRLSKFNSSDSFFYKPRASERGGEEREWARDVCTYIRREGEGGGEGGREGGREGVDVRT